MSERMSERYVRKNVKNMSERMSEGYVRKNVRRYVRKNEDMSERTSEDCFQSVCEVESNRTHFRR